MARMGTVTNLQTVRTQQDAGKSTASNLGDSSKAETCRPGEDNSLHIAGAILLIGLLAVAAGVINARISVGKD